MKKYINIERLIIIQNSFNVLHLNLKKPKLKVFTLIRRQLSLMFKAAVIISLLADKIKIDKKLSDFYLISSDTYKFNLPILKNKISQPLNQNDRSRISNVTFGKSIKLSIVTLDIIKIVRRARLENVYDFFNFPIKFNSTLELTYKNFIILSMYSKKNAQA